MANDYQTPPPDDLGAKDAANQANEGRSDPGAGDRSGGGNSTSSIYGKIPQGGGWWNAVKGTWDTKYGLGDSWINPDGTVDPQKTSQAALQAAQASSGTSPQDLMAAYTTTLQGLQVTPDAATEDLMKKAAQNTWSTSRFLTAWEQTDSFKQAFPGILDPQGNLRMDPTSYVTITQSYKDYANRYGINLGQQQVAWLIRHGVTAQVFAGRAQAVGQLTQNRQYFDAFNQTLKSEGQQPLSEGDQLRFIMGQGNASWTQTWNRATAKYASAQAGITIGKAGQYTSISQDLLNKVAQKGLTPAEQATAWQDVGQNLLETLPAARKDYYGLTKAQVVAAAFGGKGQAEARQLIAHITNQEKAFYEQPRAEEFLVQGPTGGVELGGVAGAAQGD